MKFLSPVEEYIVYRILTPYFFVVPETSAGMSESLELLSLPEEVLIKILQFLDVSSLVRLGRTCKLLNKVADAPCIWRPLARYISVF